MAVLPDEQQAYDYLEHTTDMDDDNQDTDLRRVVMRGWAVGVMHEITMRHATRNIQRPRTYGPYHVSTARRIWREQADRAQVVCQCQRRQQHHQPAAKRTQQTVRPPMPVTATTMVACPRCGHQYCNRASEQINETIGSRRYLICGREAAGSDRRHCCGRADEATAWATGRRIRVPSPPMDVRAESPVTATNLLVTHQPQQPWRPPSPPTPPELIAGNSSVPI